MFIKKAIIRTVMFTVIISMGSNLLYQGECGGDIIMSRKEREKRLNSKMIMENLLINRYTDKKMLAVGNYILSGNTYIMDESEKYKIEEGYPFDYFKKASSNNLHAQSLVDVEYLYRAYALSGDEKYLLKARDIIEDWIEYAESEISEDNIHLWYDHAVSFRVMNLIRLLLLEEENHNIEFKREFKDRVLKYIQDSSEWLGDESNYSKGNHGLMIDAALLQCSLFGETSPEKERWFALSVQRIKDRIHNDFTQGGVNVENSSYYHKMITEFFIEIDDFFQRMGMREVLTEEERDIIEGMKRFHVNIIMPNGILSPLGDTRKNKVLDGYGFLPLEYLLSKGEVGEPEIPGVKYYKESGIAFFREHFHKENMEDSIWWSFKSGADSKMHKQDDDLSFMLYGFGNEIFSDGGKYNYDRTHPRRIRALSPLSHNSLSVDEKRYYGDRSFNRIEKLEMVEDGTKGYYHFRGVNRAYAHSAVIRNFVFFKPNIIVLIDKVFSNENKKFTQHYILGENMKIFRKDIGGFSAMSVEGRSRVRVRQHIIPDRVELFHGDDKTQKGFLFNSEKNIVPVDFIQYEKDGESCTYVTSIVINHEDYHEKFLGIKKVKDGICVNISGKEYIIVDNQEISKESLNEDLKKSLAVKETNLTEIESNVFKYSVKMYNDKVKYAFYIFKDGKKIQSKEYSSDNFVIFNPKTKGKYTCRYFILSDDEKNVGLDKKISDTFEEYIVIE